jgi:hypothetical protein
MSATRILQRSGAILCALIGVYCVASAIGLVADREIRSRTDALGLVVLTLFAAFAFLPLRAFVFPAVQTPSRVAMIFASILEIAVILFFSCQVLFPHL